MIRKDNLSDRWPIRPLSDVAEFLDNQRRPVKESERVPGIYNYYGANGLQGSINDYIFDEPLVLLAEDGGHFGHITKKIAYRISGRSWVNNHAHVLRPRRGVDIGYLCRVLENYDVQPFITGTTRAKLTKGSAFRIPIPVPPITEQKRIAAILDKADALRQKRREAIAKLDELLQSVFLDMFGDPVTNPKGWDSYHFSELTTGKFRNGLSPSNIGTRKATVLTLAAITKRTFDLSQSKEGMFEKLPVDKFLSTDDFLICRGNGNLNLVGKGKISPISSDEIMFPDTMIAAKIDKSRISPEFLEVLWDSSFIRNQIERKARTTNGTFKVNQELLSSVSIQLPPIEIQRKFQEIANKLLVKKNKMYDCQIKLENLFSSLQQRAFRGDL